MGTCYPIGAWDNEEWAKKHIDKKHFGVTCRDAWEVVFEVGGEVLVSPDQLHFPPYRRYWMIGKTKAGKLLLVVWEQWRGTKNLITAFEPSKEQVKAYEAKIKNKKAK